MRAARRFLPRLPTARIVQPEGQLHHQKFYISLIMSRVQLISPQGYEGRSQRHRIRANRGRRDLVDLHLPHPLPARSALGRGLVDAVIVGVRDRGIHPSGLGRPLGLCLLRDERLHNGLRLLDDEPLPDGLRRFPYLHLHHPLCVSPQLRRRGTRGMLEILLAIGNSLAVGNPLMSVVNMLGAR